jgi:hypothetical protein
MYKILVTFKEEDYLRVIKFIEFESLAAVFVFIDQYEKHSKFECSYKIEYFK